MCLRRINLRRQSDEEWSFENQQVSDFIHQWVGDNVLNHVVNC